MSDRWYSQMLGKNGYRKPVIKRKLKADYIDELQELLGVTIDGLDRITIDTLNTLIEGVKNARIKKV